MPAQHKRPGRTAKRRRKKKVLAQQQHRDSIVVLLWWEIADKDDISPGRLTAYADGGVK